MTNRDEQGGVTTTMTIVQQGRYEWNNGFTSGLDTVTVTTTETCRYAIVGWTEGDVTLQRQHWDAVVSADGSAATTIQGFPPLSTTTTEHRTYFARKPVTPLSDVSLNPATGGGVFTFVDGLPLVRTRASDGSEGTGGLAAGMIRGLMDAAAGVAVPPGVQFRGGPSPTELSRFTFTPKAKQFSGGNQAQYSMSGGGSDGTLQASASISYTVTWEQQETDLMMRLEPSDMEEYNHWVPIPREQDNPNGIYGPSIPLQIEVNLIPKNRNECLPSGRIDLYLVDVGQHEGRCCNYPSDVPRKQDLCFGLICDDYVIDPDDPRHAYTRDRVSSITVMIEATDCGAFGKLVAKCEELHLVAEFEPTGKPYICIPRDDDENMIADAWAAEHGVSGYKWDWDEVKIDGQAVKGDGLTLYDKYRGFVVIENGQLRHRRLDPHRKHLFAIDPDNLLSAGPWEYSSCIRVYKVDDSLVRGGTNRYESRCVNFNGIECSKYAIRIEAVKLDYASEDLPVDPNAKRPPPILGVTLFDPLTPKSSPRWALKCLIYVKRIRDIWLSEFTNLYIDILQNDKEVCHLLDDNGISAEEQCSVWNAMRSATNNMESIEKIVQKLTREIALHEAGHACGVPGHVIDHPRWGPGESDIGDLHCPMRYMRFGEGYRFIILNYFLGEAVPALEVGQFCRSGYNCFGQLNVNDRSDGT